MKNFVYYRPSTPKDAVALLADTWGPTELLAGGTDLLDLQKEYVAKPDKVISLSAVKGLSAVDEAPAAITLGAGAKLAELAAHATLRKEFPSLAEAAGDIGGPQIRNMGTLR